MAVTGVAACSAPGGGTGARTSADSVVIGVASEPDTLSPLLRATHPADVVFTYRTILDLEQGGGSSLSFRADTDYRGGAPQVEKFTMAIVEDDDVRVRHAPA